MRAFGGAAGSGQASRAQRAAPEAGSAGRLWRSRAQGFVAPRPRVPSLPAQEGHVGPAFSLPILCT